MVLDGPWIGLALLLIQVDSDSLSPVKINQMIFKNDSDEINNR